MKCQNPFILFSFFPLLFSWSSHFPTKVSIFRNLTYFNQFVANFNLLMIQIPSNYSEFKCLLFWDFCLSLPKKWLRLLFWNSMGCLTDSFSHRSSSGSRTGLSIEILWLKVNIQGSMCELWIQDWIPHHWITETIAQLSVCSQNCHLH